MMEEYIKIMMAYLYWRHPVTLLYRFNARHIELRNQIVDWYPEYITSNSAHSSQHSVERREFDGTGI